MSAKVAFLLVALLIVVLPWLAWRLPGLRRIAPLAVVQIVVGVCLGPSGFGRLAPGLHGTLFAPGVLQLLDGVAALGVLLYVFVTGLHLDVSALRRDARRLGAAAFGSVALPFLLGALSGCLMLLVAPAPAPVGFVAGIAICTAVTALPVLAAILGELGLLPTRFGQTALSLAALNDAALWVMLALLLSLAGVGGAGLLGLGVATTWFALLLGVLRPVLARTLPDEPRTVLAAGVALALLSAAVSEAFGTGAIIGAFAAGVAMPESSRATLLAQLEATTATVLLPFFFMSTGLKALIDPSSPGFLLLFVLALWPTVLGKLLGTALPARRLGFSWPDCWKLGAAMGTKGLMEVVVLSVLRDAGLMGTEVFSALVAVAVVCTVVTAPVLRSFRTSRLASADIITSVSAR